jgi:hypothetical protein
LERFFAELRASVLRLFVGILYSLRRFSYTSIMRRTAEASVELNTETGKTEVLTLRVTKPERKALEQAAAKRRLTLSGYLARSAMVVAEHKRDLLAVA